MLSNEDDASLMTLAEDTIKECKLVKGSLAVISQAILILLVIITLIYKRHREKPRRDLKIWVFDVSKQAFSSLLVHIFNIALSMLVSLNYDTTSECSWYLVIYLIDNTLGVVLTLILHSLIVSIARKFSSLYQLFLKNALKSNLSVNKNNALSPHPDIQQQQQFKNHHTIQINHEIYNNNNSLNTINDIGTDIINSPNNNNNSPMRKILSLSILKEPTVIPIFDDFDTVNNSIKISKDEFKKDSILISTEEKNANFIDIIALCGYYGLPPSYIWWILQLIEWLMMVILARLTVGILDYIFKNLGLVEVTRKIDELFSGHPRSLLLFVLVIFPFFLNVILAWIKDACLKHTGYGHLDDVSDIFSIKSCDIVRQSLS